MHRHPCIHSGTIAIDVDRDRITEKTRLDITRGNAGIGDLDPTRDLRQVEAPAGYARSGVLQIDFDTHLAFVLARAQG